MSLRPCAPPKVTAGAPAGAKAKGKAVAKGGGKAKAESKQSKATGSQEVQEAVPAGAGAMYAIIGLEDAAIADICQQTAIGLGPKSLLYHI